jgi:hypothetical protein
MKRGADYHLFDRDYPMPMRLFGRGGASAVGITRIKHPSVIAMRAGLVSTLKGYDVTSWSHHIRTQIGRFRKYFPRQAGRAKHVTKVFSASVESFHLTLSQKYMMASIPIRL